MNHEGYFYDPAARLVYAIALEDRYRSAGSWPAEGFAVDLATAQAYIEHPEREGMEIVLNEDGMATIVPIKA